MMHDQLVFFIEEKYGFHPMDFQKEVLWDFYQKAKTGDLTEYFWMGVRNCKAITYQIMKDILEGALKENE